MNRLFETVVNEVGNRYPPNALQIKCLDGLPVKILHTDPLKHLDQLSLPTGQLMLQDRGVILVEKTFKAIVSTKHLPINVVSIVDLNGDESMRDPYLGYMALILDASINNAQHIQNQSGLDLGCGSGLLTLANTSMGARHMVAIDCDNQALQRLVNNVQANGDVWDPSAFDVIQADIRTLDPQEIPHANDISFVVANIGPQPDYKITPREAVSLSVRFPNLNLLILGGFFKENGQTPGFDLVESMLRTAGFMVSSRTWPTPMWQTPDNISDVVIIGRKKL